MKSLNVLFKKEFTFYALILIFLVFVLKISPYLNKIAIFLFFIVGVLNFRFTWKFVFKEFGFFLIFSLYLISRHFFFENQTDSDVLKVGIFSILAIPISAGLKLNETNLIKLENVFISCALILICLFLIGFVDFRAFRVRILGVNPNRMSFFLGIGGLFATNLFYKTKAKHVAVIALFIFMLILLGGSRNIIFSYITGLSVLLINEEKSFFLTIFILLLVTISFVFIFGNAYRFNPQFIIDNIRWKIWKSAFDAFLNKPIWGISNFELKNHLLQNIGSRISIHNGFLSLLIGGGLVGFTFFLFAITNKIRKWNSNSSSIQKSMFIFILVSALLGNQIVNPYFWVLFFGLLMPNKL